MPATANYGVQYTEYFEGYRESWSNDGTAEVVRVLECAWRDRKLFVRAMLGGVTTGINRIPPDVHPDYSLKSLATGGGGLVATNVELIAGIGVPAAGGSGGMISYDRARFAVTYKAVPYNVSGGLQVNELTADRYIIRKTNYAIESLVVPGQGLKFSSDGTKINEQMTLLMPTQEVTYTWVMAPKVPYSAINSCIGKVNHAAFDNRYEAETLLMVAPDIEPYWHPAQESVVWNITYKWIYRATEWNKFYRKSTNQFESVVGVASGAKPYQTADFTTLFQ